MKYKLLALLLLSSCSLFSPLKKQKTFDQNIAEGKCTEALTNSKSSTYLKGLSSVEQGAGYTGSYILTGIGYTSDLVVNVVGGIAPSIIICSPVIALEAASSAGSAGNVSAHCIGSVFSGIKQFTGKKFFYVGDKAYRKTHKWRCPKVKPISRALRKVASCHDRNGNTNKSYDQLIAIKEDAKFFHCLPSKEQIAIKNEIALYEEKLENKEASEETTSQE